VSKEQDSAHAELERESDRSLYEQITDSLRQQLLTQMSPGDQLPTEFELVERFSVSRSTVRKAVQQLVDEGVLTRRQGKGTFIARSIPKIVHPIDRLAPFMDTFKQMGEGVETRVIRFDWHDATNLPEPLAGWSRPILTYERLYVSRGVPHAIARVDLPNAIGRRITLEEIEQRPIYDVLTRKLKTEPVRAEFLVSCRHPSPEMSQTLELSQSTLLLVLERISYDRDGVPIEHTTHFLRPDVYQLSVSLDDLPERRK
jgi:GntR family transcriptional regulator